MSATLIAVLATGKPIYLLVIYQTNMGTIKIQAFRCDRCDHTWAPRDSTKKPCVCPKCKSPYWDVPRTRPRKN